MSNRFHSKYHRHNHHTLNQSAELDSGRDPIASPEDPFLGSFVIESSGTSPLSSITAGLALSAHGDISVAGAVNISEDPSNNFLLQPGLILGASLSATGLYDLIVGNTNTIEGDRVSILGSDNLVTGDDSAIIGSNNTDAGLNNAIVGNYNDIDSDVYKGIIIGNLSSLTGPNSGGVVFGTNSAVASADDGVAIGWQSRVLHDRSIVISTGGFASGEYVDSTSTDQLTLSAANGVVVGPLVILLDIPTTFAEVSSIPGAVYNDGGTLKIV